MNEMEIVQRQLDRLGWKNQAGGVYDARTRWAVANFQAAAGLPRTNRLDPITLNALRQAVLQRAGQVWGPGMAGSRVADIQLRLMRLGFLSWPPPVGYDYRTTEAVRAFQGYYGIAPTGLVDEHTLKKLYLVAR